MADQLRGVLREVIADQEGGRSRHPARCSRGALRAGPERPDWRILPRPQVARDDPSAGYLAAITATDPQQMIAQLQAAPERTVEVDLRLAGSVIDAGDLAAPRRCSTRSRPATRGNGVSAGIGALAELATGGPPTARATLRPSTARCPGSSRRSWRWGWPASTPGSSPKPALVRDRRPHRPVDHQRVVRAGPLLPAAGDRAGAIAAYEQLPGHLQRLRRRPDRSDPLPEQRRRRRRCRALDDLLAAGSILKSCPSTASSAIS